MSQAQEQRAQVILDHREKELFESQQNLEQVQNDPNSTETDLDEAQKKVDVDQLYYDNQANSKL